MPQSGQADPASRARATVDRFIADLESTTAGSAAERDAFQARAKAAGLTTKSGLVLGMGEDGHTASLFPHMPGLAQYLSSDCEPLCVPVPAEGERLARLSMTARMILGARHKLLVITGEDKRQTLNSALEQADPMAMPIEAFLRAPMDIFYSPDGEQDS